MHVRSGILTCVLLTLAACTDKRPARISAGTSDTVIVNDTKPSRLPVHVLNVKGHVLQVSGLQYKLVSGDRIRMSSDGRVECDRVGNAVMRASLGKLSARFRLLCRPVRELRSGTTMYLVVGDSAQDIPIGAIGLDGEPVTSFVGNATIRDTAVAILEGLRIRPRSPGGTSVEVRVGDKSVGIGVWVYERAHILEGLGHNKQTVAVPVRLANGATDRWHLPQGTYLLSILPDRSFQGRSELKLTAVGAKCTLAAFLGEHSYGCIAFAEDALVTIENSGRTESVQAFTGQLAVFRLNDQ
jgi:hypothetical protein